MSHLHCHKSFAFQLRYAIKSFVKEQFSGAQLTASLVVHCSTPLLRFHSSLHSRVDFDRPFCKLCQQYYFLHKEFVTVIFLAAEVS